MIGVTRWPKFRAHPRPCGEHPEGSSYMPGSVGSSPPVRGAPAHLTDHDIRRGLIPARAGSTGPCSVVPGASWAHPRPCGEHVSVVHCAGAAGGSSPPVRGAHEGASCEDQVGGLIPARAGSTPARSCCGCRPRAHPRPCGEHPGEDGRTEIHPGSSPPVRGAPSGVPMFPGSIGLIPARAGSTQTR